MESERETFSPLRVRIIWTIGNLLFFSGIYLVLLASGMVAQAWYYRLAARGGSDLPLVEHDHALLQRAASPPITATHEIPPPPSGISTIERLIIPAIGVDTKVIPVDRVWETDRTGHRREVWEVARYAVGHHRGSANPGEHENIVLSGHVGGYNGVFRDLIALKAGDLLTLYANGQAYWYVVAEQWLLEEEKASPEQRRANARYLEPTGAEMVTLVSCWPPDGPERYHQRLIVRAWPMRGGVE